MKGRNLMRTGNDEEKKQFKCEIKKLNPTLINDYINFFDNEAFSDGSEYEGCYCTWYHWTGELENERAKCTGTKKECFKRNMAIDYIKQGRLKGYLAYYGNQVVG